MRLYLAATEKHKYILDFEIEGMQNVCISFFGLLNKQGQGIPAYRKLHLSNLPNPQIMLDSGAHSLQTRPEFGAFDEFFHAYDQFLAQVIDDVAFAAELDIENIVGMEQVEEWFHILHDKYGDKLIRVWHGHRGMHAYKEYVKRYSYVGIAGWWKTGLTMDQLRAMVVYAYQHGTKVHGFGATNTDLCSTCPFYSVDSTSWLAGSAWGHVMAFDGMRYTADKKRFVPGTKKRRNMMLSVSCQERERRAIKEWLRYETWLTDMWTRKGVVWNE